MTELLSCPFCGRIPKTSHRPESKASGGGHVAFVVCYCGGYASTAHQMGRAENVQAAIAEVVEKWNTRAQVSQEGEAVEVVAHMYQHEETGVTGFVDQQQVDWGFEKNNPRLHLCGELMTVAQHQRILAASVGSSEPVAMKTHGAWDGLDDLANLPDGTNLYTHPAEQVADDLTMVKVPRELLEDLRDLAFDQVEHHRAAMGAYKQTRQSAMDSVLAQADALLEVKP